MDPEQLRQLLEQVRAGRTPVDDALAALRELPFRSLGFAHADTHRHLRTGFPEVVLGTGKTAAQIAPLLTALGRSGAAVMATSVGYGASFGGVAALLTMLNSCATGVAVVNIDNGFGAGRMASLLNRAVAR